MIEKIQNGTKVIEITSIFLCSIGTATFFLIFEFKGTKYEWKILFCDEVWMKIGTIRNEGSKHFCSMPANIFT